MNTNLECVLVLGGKRATPVYKVLTQQDESP
jgi:hypothetical protein